jgi:molybdopterin-guanine dinucleotide biosynthesis protein A
MLTLAIQAGGESKRMGTDKALVSFRGRTLIEQVIARLGHLGDEVLLITNKPEMYQFLGLPLVQDVIPGRGALGGLYTALHAAREPLVAVVACDMPFASPQLIKYCWEQLSDQSLDAVIPLTQRGFEPFHAVYRRETCLQMVKSAIQADRWKVDSWFDQAKIRFLDPQETQRFDPLGLAFMNLNTPDDLKEAERLAQSAENRE